MIHLNKEQQQAVRHGDGPMLVLAGPGSGKTAVLTEHIRFLTQECGIDPASVLALTFSRKAAEEMRRRFLRTEGSAMVTFGTFHSVFYQILRQNRKAELITAQESVRLLTDIARLKGIDADPAWCYEMLQKISRYKNTGKAPAMQEEEKDLFLAVTEAYSVRMKNAGLIDYEDMILLCLELLRTCPDALCEVRARFWYILIDEFQDCNMPQYELLKLLGAGRGNLFAVGDDDQSIYAFRGADSGVVSRFLSDYPGCEVVYLIRNYRCCASVIHASDSLIKNNRLRVDKPAQLPSKYRGRGTVCVLKAKDAYAEAELVCAQLSRLLSEHQEESKSIAILYRTEQCADYLTEYLSARKVIRKSQRSRSFWDTEPVKEILAYLHLSQGHFLREYFYPVLNHPNRDLVRECIGEGLAGEEDALAYYRGDPVHEEALKQLFSDLSFIGKQPPYAAICYIFYRIGWLKDYEERSLQHAHTDPEGAEKLVQELCERARDFDSVQKLLDHAKKEGQQRVAASGTNTQDPIVMQTIHASKGLEYDAVFVIGLQEGILPHKRALSTEELEEERRLLYVAMTRAKSRLYLCERGSDGDGKRPSPFMKEIRLMRD